MGIDIENNLKEKDNGEIKHRINFVFSRYFKLFMLAIILTIFAGGYIFVVGPKYKEIENKKKEISNNEELEYFKQKRKIKQLNDLINVYKNISQADMEKIDLLLPSEEKIHEELFSQIESIILRNGLLLKSLEIDTRESSSKSAKNSDSAKIKGETEEDVLPKDIGRVRINLNILGLDYFKLKDLVRVFENNLRLIDIDEINFQPDNNSAIIGFYTYYLKNK